MLTKKNIKVNEYIETVEYFNSDISMYEYDEVTKALIEYNNKVYNVEVIDYDRTAMNKVYQYLISGNCPLDRFYYDGKTKEYFIIMYD